MKYLEKENKHNNSAHKGNPIWSFVVVLFCLVMVTTWMTGGLLAKFKATDSGDDGARVAAFVFDTVAFKKSGTEEIVIPLTDICNPGDTLTYTIDVTNGQKDVVSEVDESYVITISKQGSMPLKCSLTNGSGNSVATQDGKICVEKDSIKSTFINENDSLLSAGVLEKHEYILKIEWPEGNNEAKYASGSAVGEIKIVVQAQQED